MKRGLKRLEEVIAFQCHSIFDHLKEECGPCYAMVRLSDKEIEQLSGALPSDGSYQVMSATHVMTVCNDIVSKIIYSSDEFMTLIDIFPMIPSCDDCLIKPQYSKTGTIRVFKYPMVKYASLKVEDAKRCLGDLVIEIPESIDQLHGIGLSHNDVRLENICFNDSYKAVLIDLERCMEISTMHPMFSGMGAGQLDCKLPRSNLG